MKGKHAIIARVTRLLRQLVARLTAMSIRTQLTLLFLIMLIGTTLLSNALYQRLYEDMTLDEVGEASLRTLHSIRSSIEATIENANNDSKMILSDVNVQALLSTGDLYSDLRLQGQVRTFLYKVIQDAPDIASVYLFDTSGRSYSVNSGSFAGTARVDVRASAWYRAASAAKGAFLLRLNGGGDFSTRDGSNCVSLVRAVRDINTTLPIGTLVINISETAFRKAYEDIGESYASGFCLLDENLERIILSGMPDERAATLLSTARQTGPGGATRRMSIDGESYLAAELPAPKYGWTLLSLMPTRNVTGLRTPGGMVGLAIILINGVLLVFGALLVTHTVTTPLTRMLAAMHTVDGGSFKRWRIRPGNREIRQLRDGYNGMIARMRQLVWRVVEEQKAKRRNELNVLQAQIKPHFLYNTLDSINALALMGDTGRVCDLVEALGAYYRTSLSRGKEVITVAEEIDMVRNYLAIQKIRYGELFEARYDLDARVDNMPMLKLVLQPLVENALYHGIRAVGRHGVITIVSRMEPEHLVLEVGDDGAGMEPWRVDRLLRGVARIPDGTAEMPSSRRMDMKPGLFPDMKQGMRPDKDADMDAEEHPGRLPHDDPKLPPQRPSDDGNRAGGGFGLRGTLERLRLYSGVDNVMTIESAPGAGTRIRIMIPLNLTEEL